MNKSLLDRAVFCRNLSAIAVFSIATIVALATKQSAITFWVGFSFAFLMTCLVVWFEVARKKLVAGESLSLDNMMFFDFLAGFIDPLMDMLPLHRIGRGENNVPV